MALTDLSLNRARPLVLNKHVTEKTCSASTDVPVMLSKVLQRFLTSSTQRKNEILRSFFAVI